MKQHLRIEEWIIDADRSSTETAYAQPSGPTCDCSGCRNFDAVRRIGFPSELLTLLDQLRIDPKKHGEADAPGLFTTKHPVLIQYGGWYHFAGTIDKDGANPVHMGDNWSVWFSRHIVSPKLAFRHLRLVQLEFQAQLPWILDEPYLPEQAAAAAAD